MRTSTPLNIAVMGGSISVQLFPLISFFVLCFVVKCIFYAQADLNVSYKKCSRISYNAFLSCNSFFFFLSQACTGIDNIAEAITLLELNNWDLVVSSLYVGFAVSSSRVQVQEGS